MKMLYLLLTSFSKNCAASGVIDSNSISLSIVMGLLKNFLIVIIGPLIATGGRTILTLEPSSSLVSAIGDASLTIWFDIAAILCATSDSLFSLSNFLFHLSIEPFLSMNILSLPFTIISVMLSSSSNSCKISSFLIELYKRCLSSSFCLIEITLLRLSSYMQASITSYSSLSATSLPMSSLSYTCLLSLM